MGIGGISLGNLLIILAIIILIFGTKKLRTLGGDLGGAVKGFKKAMEDEDSKQLKEQAEGAEQSGETSKKENAQ